MKQISDLSQTGATETNQSGNPVFGPSIDDAQLVCELVTDRRSDANRRQSGMLAFVYGNFRPRRRNHRREADEHRIAFDWHEPRILYLALCILLLSCTDALFTLNLLNAGASEANAVMASMLERGIDAFVVSKIVMTSLSVVILVATARRKFFRRFSVEHLLKAFCIGYILVIYYEIYLFKYVFDLDIIPIGLMTG